MNTTTLILFAVLGALVSGPVLAVNPHLPDRPEQPAFHTDQANKNGERLKHREQRTNQRLPERAPRAEAKDNEQPVNRLKHKEDRVDNRLERQRNAESAAK
jgi:hypothetical protein